MWDDRIIVVLKSPPDSSRSLTPASCSMSFSSCLKSVQERCRLGPKEKEEIVGVDDKISRGCISIYSVIIILWQYLFFTLLSFPSSSLEPTHDFKQLDKLDGIVSVLLELLRISFEVLI